MKTIFSSMGVLALMIFSFAVVTPAQAATDWDVTGTYVWNVYSGSGYFHDITIDVQNPDGTFTGYGGWPTNEDPYQTTEDVSGEINNDDISIRIEYLGPYGLGSVYNLNGTIDANGHISGTYPGWDWELVGHNATNDTDNDGVLNNVDLCPGTESDVDTWDVSLGTNRWQLGADNKWYQNKLAKQGGLKSGVYDIDDTYGCSGQQILAWLNTTYGSVMNGHHKYGLSSSVLQEFILDLQDGVMDGMYLIDSVKVNASGVAPVSSSIALLSGHNYAFKASGTGNAGDGIDFDADFSYRTPTSATWTDSVNSYGSYGATLLDLMVNGGFVEWGDGTYHADHVYWYNMAGAGAPVNFQVNDVYYPNNTGSLTVDIYAVI